MDSCHLFNFLFSTKRATSELSRCLSTLAEQRRSASKRSSSSSRAADGNCNKTSSTSTPPSSPLKQLQAKIASFGLAATARAAKHQQQAKREKQEQQQQRVDRKRSISCDARSGTYRATLVAASADDDNEAQDDKYKEEILTVQQEEEVAIVGGHLDYKDDNLAPELFQREQTEPIEESKGKIKQPADNSSTAGNEPGETGATLDDSPAPPASAPNKQNKRKRLVVLYDDSSDPIPVQTDQKQQNQSQSNQAELDDNSLGDHTSTRLVGLVSQQRLLFEQRTDYANDASADQLDAQDLGQKQLQQQQQHQRRPSRVREKKLSLTKMTGNERCNEEQDKCLARYSAQQEEGDTLRGATCESLKDKRSVFVRSLVQSIESNVGQQWSSGDSRCFAAGGAESKSLDFQSADPPNKPKRRQSSTGIARNGAITTATAMTTPTGTKLLLSGGKPVTFVKPLPPKTPPKSNKAKSLNLQLILASKPSRIEQLFQNERFLTRLFDKLEPLDRCVAAQVCRQWRNILYANRNYWKDLVNVIDCSQLRREHLVECIISTLQSAKLKQLQHQRGAVGGGNLVKVASDCLDTTPTPAIVTGSPAGFVRQAIPTNFAAAAAAAGLRCDQQQQQQNWAQTEAQSASTIELFTTDRHLANSICANGKDNNNNNSCSISSSQQQQQATFFDFDQADVWRIQELCNRFTQRATLTHRNQHHQQTANSEQQQQQNHLNGGSNQSNLSGAGGGQVEQQQQCTKSASIPSQISSTISSVSLSSLLSPLSESSRIESIKEKLYTSLDDRGFDAICLFGASDDDIEDLVCKIPIGAHKRINAGRLSNSCLSNRGIDLLVSTFGQIRELELTGCSELTNALNLKPLNQLKRLTIIDCIKIGDGYAEQLAEILGQLEEFTMLAYHCSDLFLNCLISMKPDTSNLKRLELQNCREITNQTLIMIAEYFPQLEALSLSGSSQITDDGVEIFAERTRQLRSLDLSWCARITDSSLECIACDLGDSLSELILDRNVNITDIGLGYLATMSRLSLLHIRWCPRITDIGLESVIAISSLKYLSLAGIHQITARSLLALPEADLSEVELTNCPAVNTDLILFLSARMPKCNIIF